MMELLTPLDQYLVLNNDEMIVYELPSNVTLDVFANKDQLLKYFTDESNVQWRRKGKDKNYTKRITLYKLKPCLGYDISYIRNSGRGFNYKISPITEIFFNPTPPDNNNWILKFTCSNEK